jgi:lipase maturation factor 1
MWRFRAAQTDRSVKKFDFAGFLHRLDPGSHLLTRAVFLRLLGFIYFCAFVSLWTQLEGLIGSNGILPIGSFLQEVEKQLPGWTRFHRLPTLCWISASDGFLDFQCLAGALLSIVLMLGFVPSIALAGLWVLWLSVTVAGQDFLGFQWDNLLLETGFLAIFLAPWTLKLRSNEPVSGRMLWLSRWLLFRLLFLSGMVKLLSGDPSWRNFTALFYHYETQPLPTVFGWLAYQCPSWPHVAATGVMYFIELAVPFCIFLPRKFRIFAFVAVVLLQAGIALTGNYCFFNLLTIALCVLLLDDDALRKVIPASRSGAEAGRSEAAAGPRWLVAIGKVRSGAIAIVTAIVLIVTVVQMVSVLASKESWGRSVQALYRAVLPFRSINTYGLFAVMTKTRPEIVIEGSMDGEAWKAYEFKYKPGPLTRRPKFVAPHQPRLDWQLWFAALGTYEQHPWFTSLCTRLLQGTPSVLALLETNPFPNDPPKFLRALKYEYEFTDWKTMRERGEWWRRGEPEIYLPVVSTRN